MLCQSGKVAFRSQHDAYRYIRRAEKYHARGFAVRRAYRCGCGAWHLTSHGRYR